MASVNSTRWAGLLLGFGLAGLFDGIVLHQILQWHHLLSGLASSRLDLPMQILADGIFHALMYVLVLVGLVFLWRARKTTNQSRELIAMFAIGFGTWHGVDAIFSHWILGLHRIRMDAENPLLWDLGWLAIFGLLPMAFGLWLRGRPNSGKPPGGARAACAPLAMVAAVNLAIPWTLQPASGESDTVIVVFRAGITPIQAMTAMKAVEGRLVWSDESDRVWAIRIGSNADTSLLYRSGVLLVSSDNLIAGCLGWTA